MNLRLHPSAYRLLLSLLVCAPATSMLAGPYEAGKFQGRIAWSADGNHNDPSKLNILSQGNAGRIRTRIDEPFMPGVGRYDMVIRHREAPGKSCRYRLFLNGNPRGGAWDSAWGPGGWKEQVIPGVELRIGDEIRIEVEGASSRLDYVQLNALNPTPL